MSTFIEKNSENYFNSLSENTQSINLNFMNLYVLPDLSKFNNLISLTCNHNNLRILPELPKTLKYLSCYGNNLDVLPKLPNNLKFLDCSNNNLYYLPELPNNIEKIYCISNNLHSLPKLPNNLKKIDCSNNNLILLPSIPYSLYSLYCHNNKLIRLPNLHTNIEEIISDFNLDYTNCTNGNVQLININQVDGEYNMFLFIEIVNKINKFVFFYYCLKYKNKLRKFLYEKIILPKVVKEFHPSNIKLLDELYNEAIEENI